jgi:hypothetical protein
VDVAVPVGGAVRPLGASWDRVGQVLVTAADTTAAVILAERLAEKITITTGPDPDPDPDGT